MRVSKIMIFAAHILKLTKGSVMFLIAISITLPISCNDVPRSKPCATDTDCREGYTCDLIMFVGECVQRQMIQACGDTYCLIPQERCEQDQCIFNEGLDDSMSRERIAGAENTDEQETQAAGVMMEEIERNTAGAAAGVMAPDISGMTAAHDEDTISGTDMIAVAGDISEEEILTPWILDIDGWSNQSILSAQNMLRMTGRLSNETGDVPLSARLILQISPISVFTQLPSTVPHGWLEIPIEPSGHFELSLPLDIGSYRLEVQAQDTVAPQENLQDQIRARRSSRIVIDDFVSLRGSELYLNQNSFRYLGVSLPDILPWLGTLSVRSRPTAIRQVWRALAAAGVRVARVYVGWTDQAFRLHDARGSLELEHVALLELALVEASLEGIKVICVLADGARELDTLSAYLQAHGIQNPTALDELSVYQTTPARTSLYQWLTMLPQHQSSLNGLALKDDPSILGWELLHRPTWSRVTEDEELTTVTLDRSDLTIFLEEAVEQLTQVAPNQLIFTGEIGLDINPTPYQPWAQQLNTLGLEGLLSGTWGGTWSELRSALDTESSPNLVSGFTLDHDALHFPASVSWPQAGQLWIRAHTTAHININRPIVVHLARVRRDLLMPTQQTQTLLQWARESMSQGVDGFVFGELRLTSSESILLPYDWSFEDPKSHILMRELAEAFTADF